MEPRQPVRKSVAVVSAILFVGAFVAYRGGASFMSGSKSNPVFTTVVPSAPPKGSAPQGPPPDYLSGSKSTFIFVGSGIKPPTTPTPADKTPPTGDEKTPTMPPPVKPGE